MPLFCFHCKRRLTSYEKMDGTMTTYVLKCRCNDDSWE